MRSSVLFCLIESLCLWWMRGREGKGRSGFSVSFAIALRYFASLCFGSGLVWSSFVLSCLVIGLMNCPVVLLSGLAFLFGEVCYGVLIWFDGVVPVSVPVAGRWT